MSETSSVAEASAAAFGSKATFATYAGSGTTLAAFFMSIDWLAVIGVIIGVAGFIINTRYQKRRNKREEFESQARMKREQEIHEIKLRKLKEGCDVK